MTSEDKAQILDAIAELRNTMVDQVLDLTHRVSALERNSGSGRPPREQSSVSITVPGGSHFAFRGPLALRLLFVGAVLFGIGAIGYEIRDAQVHTTKEIAP